MIKKRLVPGFMWAIAVAIVFRTLLGMPKDLIYPVFWIFWIGFVFWDVFLNILKKVWSIIY